MPTHGRLIVNNGTMSKAVISTSALTPLISTCRRRQLNPVMVHLGSQWGCSSMVKCSPNIKRRRTVRVQGEKDLILYEYLTTSERCLRDEESVVSGYVCEEGIS